MSWQAYKQKDKMKVIQIRFKNGWKFVFEFGEYVYETDDLWGSNPKYALGFALALVFRNPKEYGKYKFGKDYIGIII